MTRRRAFPLIGLLSAGLAVTGLAQMPIAKRYYIADIPGLAWTGDYLFTHYAHYVLAGLLLLVLARTIVTCQDRRLRPTAWGGVRLVLWAGVLLTGVLRVLKGLGPTEFIMPPARYLDWGHLLFVCLLGLTALAARLKGRDRVANQHTQPATPDVAANGAA